MQTPTPRDIAQRGWSLFLRRVAAGKQGDVAKAMDMSDGQLSDLKNKSAEKVLLMLAHYGLKVVDAEQRSLSSKAFDLLTETHARLAVSHPELIWQDSDL